MCIAFHPNLPSVVAGGSFNGTFGMLFARFSWLKSEILTPLLSLRFFAPREALENPFSFKGS